MNKTNIKKIAPIALGIAILLVLFIGIGSRKTEKDKITLILDFSGEKKQVLQVSFSEQKRAWSLLQQAAAATGIDLMADNDFMPIKIDGFTNSENKQWVFYVNGVRQNTSPYEVNVKAPDKIIFRFE